jgi:hypothetical protein
MTEIGRIFSTCGEVVHKEIYWEKLREREHLEDPGLEERILLK